MDFSRASFGLLAVCAFGYIVLLRLVLAKLNGNVRAAAFAIINLVAYTVVFLPQQVSQTTALTIFALYFTVVSFQWVTMRRFAQANGNWPWVAFLIPIVFMICVKYGGKDDNILTTALSFADVNLGVPLTVFFVGISYLAFRSSYLVLEVRNGTVPVPSYFEYMGFCFFLPTSFLGPISPYSRFRESFLNGRENIQYFRSMGRICIGCGKYFFLGALFNQLAYDGLVNDGNLHPGRLDFVIAAVCYYFYIFCNFSGFCDIVIGISGLLGIDIAENFDNPFIARNIREFWNRWHITLSQYMRDVVFTPLSKALVSLFGPRNASHAIGVSVFVVFLLVGLWHGVSWNFIVFGLAMAFGVVIHYYYTLLLKKILGRNGFEIYNKSIIIRVISTVITFMYMTCSFVLFAWHSRGMVMYIVTQFWHGH